MKIYDVRVTAYIPYPITKEYIVKSSSLAVAVVRGVKLYRKEPRVARKRLNRITVQAAFGGALKGIAE